MAEILFWFSLLFVFYVYFGYPVLLFVISHIFPKPVHKEDFIEWPEVSVVIAAKNEEENIGKRLENLCSQDYPFNRLEIIVVSDGSSDRTVSIVERFIDKLHADQPKIKVFEKDVSSGKPTALNLGVSKAKGEMVVFADARQSFAGDALKKLISNFNDQNVGGVSGELLFVEKGGAGLAVEMGGYWKYEKIIRKLESSCGSVVGATGAIYAIRRDLYQELPPATLLDDVLIPICIISRGYRVVFESKALAYDTVSGDMKSEWKRKIRTLTGNWQLLSIAPTIYYIIRGKIFWRFFSHKFSRLMVPLFLVVMLFSSFLEATGLYFWFFLAQVIFYSFAVTTHYFVFFKNINLLRLVYFFCVMNLAAVCGFYIWITGDSSKVWR